MGELRKKAIKGVFWSGIEKVGVKTISFIVSIIIARILTPSDYGIIGMILIFIAIANIFIDSGMSQALVQKKNRTDADLSTAFYFNMAIAFVCYIVLFFTAPLISRFYNVDILTPILRVLGLNIIISSFATVQRANLLATLDFKTIAFVNLVGVIVSGGVGIWMAYTGFGVWALVFQQMSSLIVSTSIYWIIGKWKPHSSFSIESFRHLWNFGSKLLATGLVATILREIYTVAIGKYYKSNELGYYTRAVQTSDMVALTTNDLINAVTFPVLSTLQDNRQHLAEVYSKMMGMTAFFVFPIMTGLAVVAEPLVSVLLTDKWLPAVPLLQWLCFARIFTPISSLNMNILNAVGRSDLFMKVDFSKIPLEIIMIIVTIPLGVKAIVIGNFISTFLCYFINAYLPGKIFDFGVITQSKIFWKIAFATSIMALCILCSMMLFESSIIKICIGPFVGIISYIILSYILRIREYEDILHIMKSVIKSKLNKY